MGGRLCDDSGTSLRFRIGIALAVVAFAGTASAASAPTIRLYGLVFPAHGNPEPMSLARLDPSTLAPVGQPTLLGQFIGFAVLSPDARRVAVVEPRSAVIRLYEDVTLQSRLVLGSGDEQVRDVVWTSPDRFVAIVQRMSRPYARYVRARYAVGVDAARGRVLFRTRFGQRLALMSTATSHGSAALLFKSSNLLARHARLTVVSATGTVRSVTLRFGAVRTTRLLAAALAVDAASSRAYVVLSGGRVAVIDLRTLRVAYHVVHPLPHESTATDWVTFRAARFGRHFLVVDEVYLECLWDARTESCVHAGPNVLTTNTNPFNLTGMPALSLPCGFTAAGLPIGLQILGAPFEEEKLLRVARMHEQATDWHTRRAKSK